MLKIKEKLTKLCVNAQTSWFCFCNDVRGDTNIVAIALLILVVISVVAIFRTGLEGIITDLIGRIKGEMAA